jgi:hypothetical protein
MSILGVLIDQTTVSRVGDNLKAVTFASLAHSLPATNPQIVLPVLRSISSSGGTGGAGQRNFHLLGLGGNASLATIGYAAGSAASFPTICFDILSIVFHSTIQ